MKMAESYVTCTTHCDTKHTHCTVGKGVGELALFSFWDIMLSSNFDSLCHTEERMW